MKAAVATLLTMLLAGAVSAADREPSAHGWQLATPDVDRPTTLETLFPHAPAAFGPASLFGERPRLSVALSPAAGEPFGNDLPSFSWSLEAWEMNTASLAHIQCSHATRTIETFLAENCRFVDGPLPSDSPNLVQVRGQWMATPDLKISAGAFSGRDSLSEHLSSPVGPAGFGPARDRIQGVNLNVSFGLRVGQVGDLLLDLQLERYRRTPDPFSFGAPTPAAAFGSAPVPTRGPGAYGTQYGTSGQLGVGWRSQNFGADLTGQYRELPYWLGNEVQGEGFRSFDLEFSWRAPAQSSISVGVSNLLDRLPGAATRSSKQRVEDAVDGIYGRIPYVRYKHDL